MNSVPTETTSPAVEPVSAASKFVLLCFVAFFVLIGTIAFVDLAAALLR